MKQNSWITPATNELFEAILSLDSLEQAQCFFRDLLTEPEIAEFANRWKVAQMLNRKVPYSQIEQETGMSSTTIARISKWLYSGMGGYRLALSKLHQHHNSLLFKDDS